VARRAEVLSSSLLQSEEGGYVFTGSYRPYWDHSYGSHHYWAAKNQPVHTRELKQINNQWIITDEVSGAGNHAVKNYLHLHPDVSCMQDEEYIFFTGQNKLAKIDFSDNVVVSIERGCYCPEFGKIIENTVIVLTWTGALPVKLQYTITVL